MELAHRRSDRSRGVEKGRARRTSCPGQGDYDSKSGLGSHLLTSRRIAASQWGSPHRCGTSCAMDIDVGSPPRRRHLKMVAFGVWGAGEVIDLATSTSSWSGRPARSSWREWLVRRTISCSCAPHLTRCRARCWRTSGGRERGRGQGAAGGVAPRGARGRGGLHRRPRFGVGAIVDGGGFWLLIEVPCLDE